MGQIAMAKAHVSRVGRDVVRLAREIQGANGLLLENLTIRFVVDMEAAHTGEGTYDIIVLVTGRELTGISTSNEQVAAASLLYLTRNI